MDTPNDISAANLNDPQYEKLNTADTDYDRVKSLRDAGVYACDARDHNEPEGCSNPICFKYHADGPSKRGILHVLSNMTDAEFETFKTRWKDIIGSGIPGRPIDPIPTLSERSDDSLIDLVMELHTRSHMYPDSKVLHDAWLEAKGELSRRMAQRHDLVAALVKIVKSSAQWETVVDTATSALDAVKP